jgi:hypothetical protein
LRTKQFQDAGAESSASRRVAVLFAAADIAATQRADADVHRPSGAERPRVSRQQVALSEMIVRRSAPAPVVLSIDA